MMPTVERKVVTRTANPTTMKVPSLRQKKCLGGESACAKAVMRKKTATAMKETKGKAPRRLKEKAAETSKKRKSNDVISLFSEDSDREILKVSILHSVWIRFARLS